jgi:hypothetical protein
MFISGFLFGVVPPTRQFIGDGPTTHQTEPNFHRDSPTKRLLLANASVKHRGCAPACGVFVLRCTTNRYIRMCEGDRIHSLFLHAGFCRQCARFRAIVRCGAAISMIGVRFDDVPMMSAADRVDARAEMSHTVLQRAAAGRMPSVAKPSVLLTATGSAF